MDCYAVLEVPPDASEEMIRAAYRRLAQEWHPDKNTVTRHEATRRMSEINLAWEILKDPETRRLNDEARVSSSYLTPTVETKLGKPVRRHAEAPTMLEVDSGCVRSIGHDGKDRLFIEFRTGGLYVYRDVPDTLYRSLLFAKSKGRFVIFNIVNGPYLCKRIGA
jgi:curved DNA-binding protein CbpA